MKCFTFEKVSLNRFLCLLLSIFMLFGTGMCGFALEGQREGISLTADEILTVNEDALNGQVEISAAADGVELSESRQDFGFPEPGEAVRLTAVYDPFLDDRILNGIRAVCVMIALLLSALYLWWKKRDRRSERHEES